jgi:energy-coupling factor transporter ATP-binding protein EcfA2
MNPFDIPGASGRPNAPLRPWHRDTPQHKDYYVPVDNTLTAFEEFQVNLATPGDLMRGGWFVVVTGHPGCGKTSLVNRCAHWLAHTLAGCPIKATIADVSDAAAENEEIDERMKRVCRRLTNRWLGPLVKPDQRQLLADSCDDPSDFYPLLSDALEDRVLIVLLPPAELIEEVRKYAWLCREKIVFFVESSFEQVAGSANVLRIPDTTRMTRLTVHALGEGDGRSFQVDRMNRHDGRGPGLDEEAAEQMVAARLGGLGTSIGQLQTLLHGAYEDAARQPNHDRVIINYDYLRDYVVRRALSFP